MLMPVLKPARTSNIPIKDWLPDQAVHTDIRGKIRGLARIIVWCALFPGRVFTLSFSFNLCNLCNLWILLKDWIPGQVTPPNRCALWRGPRQPGMTRFWGLEGLFRAASAINTSSRHHSTTKVCLGLLFTIKPFINPADPVDPVIRVLFFWFMKAKRKAATKPPVLL